MKLKDLIDYCRTRATVSGSRGFIFWYMAAAIGAILVFYVIFFLFWSEIKTWFVTGH